MTNDEWWNEIGSGMPPMPEEDTSEHVKRVIAACWPAARAAIYDAESAQLTEPLRAKIELLSSVIQRAACILHGGDGVQDQGEAWDRAIKLLDAAVDDMTPNVEVTGDARLHRAASVWTAGLGAER